MSPNEFYQQRQTRYTLPQLILNKINDNGNNKSLQEHQEEVVNLLIIANQIRALCQKDNGKTRSSKQLQKRMIQLTQFSDKYVDELWKRSNDVDVHKCILNISDSLISAKTLLQDALKVRFRRNSMFNNSLRDINVDIGNKIAALEMTLTGENVLDYGDLAIGKNMSKANRGEFACIAGHRSYFGHGTKQNYEVAFSCYKKSAELNNCDGQNHLAMMYEKGIGCIKNIDKAINYYKLSIDLNNTDAMFNLANLYFNNLIYNDISSSIRLYKQAAELGHIAAQTTLAGLYQNGVNNYLEPNIQLSIKWYRKAANSGHLEAKNNLAVVLLNNFDCNSKEYFQAITLLKEAANNGNASAQNNLGHCYEFGKGVEKNENLAIEWYSKSASQNYYSSFINLGYLQMKKYQYQNAFENFLKASKNENGNGNDQKESWYYIGLMHEKGYYVPINPYLAFEFFQKASKNGHIPSTLKMGDCYFSGIAGYIEQNYSKSFDIYKKLALDGNSIAANNLGIMYEEGLGIKVDLECAEMWYKMGAEKNNKDAIRNEKRLSQLLGK